MYVNALQMFKTYQMLGCQDAKESYSDWRMKASGGLAKLLDLCLWLTWLMRPYQRLILRK